jgi:hypothetical protein
MPALPASRVDDACNQQVVHSETSEWNIYCQLVQDQRDKSRHLAKGASKRLLLDFDPMGAKLTTDVYSDGSSDGTVSMAGFPDTKTMVQVP